MHELTNEEFATLSKLCRIQCSPEEEQELLDNIRKILSYMQLLEELPTQEDAATSPSTTTFLRPDVIGPCLPKEAFLANAPDVIAGMIKIPPVFS